MTHAIQSAATEAAQHFTGQYLPLEQVTKPNLKTNEAAYYLNRAPQTMRIWAMRRLPHPKRAAGGFAVALVAFLERGIGASL